MNNPQIIANYRQLAQREFGVPTTLSDQQIDHIVESVGVLETSAETDDAILGEMAIAEEAKIAA